MESRTFSTTEGLLSITRAILGEEECYTRTYDLIHLHSRAACAFSLDPYYVPHIEKEIETARPGVEREKLVKERDILMSSTRWRWFYRDVRDYLKTFISPHSSSNDILSAVRQYVEVLKRSFPFLSITWVPQDAEQCRVCGVQLGESSTGICARCDGSDEAPREIKPKDKVKKNMAGSVENFMRCIEAIEADSSVPLPELVSRSLDDYARNVGMYTSTEIQLMELDQRGHRGPYQMCDLMELLKLTGHSEYYPDKWYVARVYWGWEPHRFDASLKDELRRDCATVFSLYAEDNETRSINREWLALRLLICYLPRLSKPLCVEDFGVIKTPEILEDYESTWESFCQRNVCWRPVPIYGSWR